MIPNHRVKNLTPSLAARRARAADVPADQAPRFVDVAAAVGLGLLIAMDLLLAAL